MWKNEEMTRESAIDVYVPELVGLLDRWRLPTIAVAAKEVPPHISLLYPWRPAPVGPSDITEAAAVVAGISPFTMAAASGAFQAFSSCALSQMIASVRSCGS